MSELDAYQVCRPQWGSPRKMSSPALQTPPKETSRRKDQVKLGTEDAGVDAHGPPTADAPSYTHPFLAGTPSLSLPSAFSFLSLCFLLSRSRSTKLGGESSLRATGTRVRRDAPRKHNERGVEGFLPQRRNLEPAFFFFFLLPPACSFFRISHNASRKLHLPSIPAFSKLIFVGCGAK